MHLEFLIPEFDSEIIIFLLSPNVWSLEPLSLSLLLCSWSLDAQLLTVLVTQETCSGIGVRGASPPYLSLLFPLHTQCVVICSYSWPREKKLQLAACFSCGASIRGVSRRVGWWESWQVPELSGDMGIGILLVPAEVPVDARGIRALGYCLPFQKQVLVLLCFSWIGYTGPLSLSSSILW